MWLWEGFETFFIEFASVVEEHGGEHLGLLLGEAWQVGIANDIGGVVAVAFVADGDTDFVQFGRPFEELGVVVIFIAQLPDIAGLGVELAGSLGDVVGLGCVNFHPSLHGFDTAFPHIFGKESTEAVENQPFSQGVL